MNFVRQKLAAKLKSYAKALEVAYNDSAGAFKHIPVLPKIANGGVAIDTAAAFPVGSLVMLLNTDTAIHYFRTGDSSVTAPSGASNGVPILAGERLIVSLGDDNHIRSDSNKVYALAIDDETYATPDNSR